MREEEERLKKEEREREKKEEILFNKELNKTKDEAEVEVEVSELENSLFRNLSQELFTDYEKEDLDEKVKNTIVEMVKH